MNDAEKLAEIRDVVGFWQHAGANNAGVGQVCKNITRILNGEPPDPNAATMDAVLMPSTLAGVGIGKR